MRRAAPPDHAAAIRQFFSLQAGALSQEEPTRQLLHAEWDGQVSQRLNVLEHACCKRVERDDVLYHFRNPQIFAEPTPLTRGDGPTEKADGEEIRYRLREQAQGRGNHVSARN
jgi:hypothetical protein